MAEGYIFLAELLLSLETDLKVDEESSDGADALRNLVLLVASLTTCGFIELKPTAPTTGNQPGFRLPRPMGRGVSVRNTNAFQGWVEYISKLKYILPKIGLTGQFLFFRVCLTEQLENFDKRTVLLA